jgi:hypothetical protein
MSAGFDEARARMYGALDLVFAALYAWFGFVFTPGRSAVFNAALALVVAVLALAGLGLLTGVRWARAVAVLASILLLTFAAVVVSLLVASSAYLSGIYGAIGRGMAVITMIIAAVVVEAFALLPLFQLRFLIGKPRA